MSPGPGLLLERERELGEIVDLLERARAGSGGALLVEGPGGIGKTRLLLAAESAARERDMAVATARGAELEREYAFGVVRQLFERALSRPGGTELLTGAAELATPVFAAAQADHAAPGHDERSFAVLHGLHWLCVALAERAPLLLVVDDAHWSDPPSLDLLAYLARRVDELALALLVASRPAEEAAEQHLLGSRSCRPSWPPPSRGRTPGSRASSRSSVTGCSSRTGCRAAPS